MGLKLLQRLLIIGFIGAFVIIFFVGILRMRNSSNLNVVPLSNQPQSPNNNQTQNIQTSTKDGTFTGQAYQTRYGDVAVSITTKNGKIENVVTPIYPSSPPSIDAHDTLISQAIQAGSANIQGVSGATVTSIAFQNSLENAIVQAGTSPSQTPIPIKSQKNHWPFGGFGDD